jgi:hypothetical protein
MKREGLLTFTLYKHGLSADELRPSPIHDGAEFISGALRATAKAAPKIREAVQGDMAEALNCHADALSFLWKDRIKGVATLECEIPDFRTALNDRSPIAMAAE